MEVVGYIRLSRDEDRENYSSINSQQELIKDYAKDRGWKVNKMYIDDNCSGYTFERDAFHDMMEQVLKGTVDVILTKDLSRIGRNNGRVLLLIDQLRELNKRLILISEGSKGLDLLEEEWDILGIKTWYNEMYIKDISRKIRSSMHNKQKKGELLMGNFYGYKKDKNGVSLIVDEEIRPVIQMIFKLYIEGLSLKRICERLDLKGHPTPSVKLLQEHRERERVFKNAVSYNWQPYMLKRIIQNDIYIGRLRTQKRHARTIKGKQEKVPLASQFVFENHHEAIISILEFERANKRGRSSKRVGSTNKAKYPYLFGGLMECGTCGHTATGLNLRKLPVVQRGYNCSLYQKYGKSKCNNHSIKEEKVIFYVRELLKEIKIEYGEYIDNAKRMAYKNDTLSMLKELRQELNAANSELKSLLLQRNKDLSTQSDASYIEIIEKAYMDIEKEKKNKIIRLTDELDGLKIKQAHETSNATNSDILYEFIEAVRPDKQKIGILIDKITILSDRTLVFDLNVNVDRLCLS